MHHLSLQRRSAERGLAAGIFFEGIDLLMASAEGRGTRANPFFLPAPKCSLAGGVAGTSPGRLRRWLSNQKALGSLFPRLLSELSAKVTAELASGGHRALGAVPRGCKHLGRSLAFRQRAPV